MKQNDNQNYLIKKIFFLFHLFIFFFIIILIKQNYKCISPKIIESKNFYLNNSKINEKQKKLKSIL